MAIEKMKLLNLVGALDEENSILQELVLSESVHLNLGHDDTYDNNYMMHEYEAMMPAGHSESEADDEVTANQYKNLISTVKTLCTNYGQEPHIEKREIKKYTLDQAVKDLKDIQEQVGPHIKTIIEKKEQSSKLKEIKQYLTYIQKKINFTDLNRLNYFKYEIGMLSRENRVHIKKNYENISALVFEIGEITDSREDIYLTLYLRQFEEETQKILKSLNWRKIDFGVELRGEVEDIQKEIVGKLSVLEKQIARLEKDLLDSKEKTLFTLNRIYTRLQMELKIINLKEELFRGNNVFVLSAWIKENQYDDLEEEIADVTDKYVMLTKSPEELDEGVKVPTALKNNWFTKPFEMIVRLYGLPSYKEIDPTPILAITFCLMFGIMFGDVGQGLVYFLAGLALAKKMPDAGGILERLGMSSMIFGVVYGSAFGLEEIPILKDIALVQGGPLSNKNIMPILIMGVIFGVVVLTISFMMGIINAYRRRDVEGVLFGKNGVAGYVFFMGLIMSGVCIVGVIPVSVIVPVSIMIIMLMIMVFKEPLAHLVMGEKPLINGDKSSYFVESGFEGFETVLSTLSNALSFIRVGAFALNHAGLFLAFSVMADMASNMLLKIIILILGNVLILTLEGLVVFIQGLRLQYYEMFSKYFSGDGLAYAPIKIENINE